MVVKKNTKPMAEGKTARERLKNLALERRLLLFDAATAAFAERGFSAASMNAILSSAEMSKGQAYYYVHDKADLYCAVIECALEDLAERLDFERVAEAEDAPMFWKALNDAVEELAELLIAESVMAALGRTMYEGPQTEAALQLPLERIRKATETLVSHGQKLEAIRSDMPLTMIVEMLFAAARALDRWFAENWDELDRDEARRINREGLGMIRAMVAPPADDFNRSV